MTIAKVQKRGEMLQAELQRFYTDLVNEQRGKDLGMLAAVKQELDQLLDLGWKLIASTNLSPADNAVRQRWLRLIEKLADHPSNRNGENGSEAIVNALLENFASSKPLPVYFTSHDMQGKPVQESRVLVTHGARPVHYLEVDYLVISLPMQSREAAARMREKR